MFGKLLTNQKIAHKIVKPYVYKALREGLKTHDNGKIQNLRGFGSLSLRLRICDGPVQARIHEEDHELCGLH